MTGYVPVFGSIFQGTLCGRWPDTGVWLCLLALADKNGHIDMTIPYISAVTGVPVDVLAECITRFSSPDPFSRTQTDDGRRLAPLDPARAWGWLVINHGKYREKARLMAKSQDEKSSGKNASRMKDRRRPPETASDPLSDADADTNKEKRKNASTSSKRMPMSFVISEDLRKWASEKTPGVNLDSEVEAVRDWEFQKAHSDWNAVVRRWVRKTFNERQTKLRPNGKDPYANAI